MNKLTAILIVLALSATFVSAKTVTYHTQTFDIQDYTGQAYGGYAAGSSNSQSAWEEHQARMQIPNTNEWVLANYLTLSPWRI